jgi:hypothetical protein
VIIAQKLTYVGLERTRLTLGSRQIIRMTEINDESTPAAQFTRRRTSL